MRARRRIEGAQLYDALIDPVDQAAGIPPIEEWPAEAFDRLLAAIHEARAPRWLLAWWQVTDWAHRFRSWASGRVR